MQLGNWYFKVVSPHRASSSILPLQEAAVRLPVGEARPAHHHVLHQAEVGHLVLAARVVEQHRRLHLVGLYASHVVRLLKGKRRREAGYSSAGVVTALFIFETVCF